METVVCSRFLTVQPRVNLTAMRTKCRWLSIQKPACRFPARAPNQPSQHNVKRALAVGMHNHFKRISTCQPTSPPPEDLEQMESDVDMQLRPTVGESVKAQQWIGPQPEVIRGIIFSSRIRS